MFIDSPKFEQISQLQLYNHLGDDIVGIKAKQWK